LWGEGERINKKLQRRERVGHDGCSTGGEELG